MKEGALYFTDAFFSCPRLVPLLYPIPFLNSMFRVAQLVHRLKRSHGSCHSFGQSGQYHL